MQLAVAVNCMVDGWVSGNTLEMRRDNAGCVLDLCRHSAAGGAAFMYMLYITGACAV